MRIGLNVFKGLVWFLSGYQGAFWYSVDLLWSAISRGDFSVIVTDDRAVRRACRFFWNGSIEVVDRLSSASVRVCEVDIFTTPFGGCSVAKEDLGLLIYGVSRLLYFSTTS